MSYKLDDHKISYKTKLHYPSLELRAYVPSLNRIKVKGTVSQDYRGKYACRVKLDTGRIVSCEQPYGVGVILAGTPCEFEISPTAKWAHNVRSVKKLKQNSRVAIPTSIKIEWVDYTGDPKVLTDTDTSLALQFDTGKDKNKRKDVAQKATITYTFAKPVRVTSGVFSINNLSKKEKGSFSYTVEAYERGKWQLIRDKYQYEYFDTLVANSNKFRITFTIPGTALNVTGLTLQAAPAKRSIEQIKKEYTW